MRIVSGVGARRTEPGLLRGRPQPPHVDSPWGEGPDRFRGALLCRSPPRPSAFAGALEVPTIGLRAIRMHGRANPPDLDADFPVASRVSTIRRANAGHPLLGLSKDRPSIVPSRRVRLPGPTLPCRPSERGRRLPRAPSSWFLTTSTVCSSSTVQVCFTLLPILGFAAFPFVTKRSSPQRWSCPSKPSLRRQRRSRYESVFVGARHVRTIAGPPFTARLALSPFLLENEKVVSHLPCRVSPACARGRGLRAFLHRRVRCRPNRFQSEVLGAPVGLTDSTRCPLLVPLARPLLDRSMLLLSEKSRPRFPPLALPLAGSSPRRFPFV